MSSFLDTEEQRRGGSGGFYAWIHEHMTLNKPACQGDIFSKIFKTKIWTKESWL